MSITTDKGKRFDVRWAWGPAGEAGRLMIELTADDRPLSQIAADFEGVALITRQDENEGDATFAGYTQLVRIERIVTGGVQLALEQAVTA